jgi:hypothetical protein
MSANVVSSKTGSVVHIAGKDPKRPDATLCSPSGMQRNQGNGWSGDVQFQPTTQDVTCQACLRSLGAAYTAALKLDTTNGVEPTRYAVEIQRDNGGEWVRLRSWARASRAGKEMDDELAHIARSQQDDPRRTHTTTAIRVVNDTTGEVLRSEPTAAAAPEPTAAADGTDAPAADVVTIGSAGSVRAGVLRVVPDLPTSQAAGAPADPPTVEGCEVHTISAGMNRVRAFCDPHNCRSGFTPPTEEAARWSFRCDGGRGWRFLVSWDDELVGVPPQPPRLEELTLAHNWLTRQLTDRPYDVLTGRAITIRIWVGGAQFVRLSVVRDTRPGVDPGGYLLVGPDGTTYTAVHRDELD